MAQTWLICSDRGLETSSIVFVTQRIVISACKALYGISDLTNPPLLRPYVKAIVDLNRVESLQFLTPIV